MNRIRHMLIIGAFSAGSIENFYKRGFEKCGVQTDSYASVDHYYQALRKKKVNRLLNKISPGIFYRKINEQLLSFVGDKKYDAILVFKGMELYEATVRELRQHTDIMANYNPDHPFTFYSPGSGNANVCNSIKQYDVHFSYSGRIVEQLKNDFQARAFCIPFGYDSHATGSARPDTKLYGGRFLFIGTYDKERAATLDELGLPDLDIYGDAKWASRNLSRPNIIRAFRQASLYGDDYIDAAKSSSGIINLLRQQNMAEGSHNMRTFEVPGYGGLLISQRTAEQQAYFTEDREAVYFDTVAELREKINFLQKHPSVAEGIQKAGYEKSRRCKYDYDERSRSLLTHLVTA